MMASREMTKGGHTALGLNAGNKSHGRESVPDGRAESDRRAASAYLTQAPRHAT